MLEKQKHLASAQLNKPHRYVMWQLIIIMICRLVIILPILLCINTFLNNFPGPATYYSTVRQHSTCYIRMWNCRYSDYMSNHSVGLLGMLQKKFGESQKYSFGKVVDSVAALQVYEQE